MDPPNIVFEYIDQILMEEDLEEKMHYVLDSVDFKEKERSFYELLDQKYPHSPPQQESSIHNNQCDDKPNDDHLYDSRAIWDFRTGVVHSGNSFPSEGENTVVKTRGKKKNHLDEETSLEEEERRSNKLPTIRAESNLPTEDFDNGSTFTLTELTEHENQTPECKGSEGKKKKKEEEEKKKKQAINLIPCLVRCAESVALGKIDTSKEILKKIRKHSSPFGDGNQRLAYYFANALEARLFGTGSLMLDKFSVSDYFRTYRSSHFLSSFKDLVDFASNETIAAQSAQSGRVHIIDFGIFYGFQWPAFIQSLAEREGGPPKLRITAVDFPLPGQRLAQVAGRDEDTGRWLARFAETHRVPFEFNAIVKRWETIEPEDLRIEKGEYVAVNCRFRSMVLPNETEAEEKKNSRARFLELVSKINPDIFVHGVFSSGHGEPLFLSRFKSSLLFYYAFFEMLDTTEPREQPYRVTIERMFGRAILNVVACEGPERVDRPETYRKWGPRHLRAGLAQVPFDGKLLESVTYKAKKIFPRNFVFDEDNGWLLMSWKKRTIAAFSCWQSAFREK
ncbi:Scarecrow-like protein 9 [Striga hermonthica]|uniref:Scarecrow-like protein 9 n=1 Tax=Striga hermonthica TaxID=68872 RepID=A0A9N7RHJ6_STRHE|nr:Scarecrow-like protein 9 [Striga hermonthica]